MKLTITGFDGCKVRLVDEAGRPSELDIFEICALEEDAPTVVVIGKTTMPARIDSFAGKLAILEYTTAEGVRKFISKPIHEVAKLRIGERIEVNILQSFAA